MRTHTREAKTAGGAHILDGLTADDLRIERQAPRNALAEAMRAWPGDPFRLWWKWFEEAAKSFGLAAKSIDCSVDEAVDLVLNGARLVMYRDTDKGEWLASLSSNVVRMEVIQASQQVRRRSVSAKKLRKLIENFAFEGRVRCVVVQDQRVAIDGGAYGRGLHPLTRLRQLLYPEWSDIWIVVVFAFVVGLLTLATPIAVEALVNTVAFGRLLQPVVILALILLIFLGFLAAVRALQTYVVEIIQRRLFARIAADLAYRLPRTETEATDSKHVPELVNRFFEIVTVQKVTAQLLLDGLGLVLSAVIGMAVLAFYHPWLLGFDVVLLASIAFIIFVLGRGAVSSAVDESKYKYAMASWLEDIAGCSVAFRGEGGPNFAMERADRLANKYLAARKRHFRVLMRQVVFALALQAVASTVLLGLGGWLVISGELTLGQLVAAELIVTAIVAAFAKLGKHMESFYDLMASMDKLGVLFDLPVEQQTTLMGEEADGPVDIQLHGVAYSWPGGPKVLQGVTFLAKEQTSVAVCGPSGSGKSVLFDLICGLRPPTAGHLTLDGFDPRNVRRDRLGERVALVRSGDVFHGTLEENVHLHRPHVSSTDVRELMVSLGQHESIVRLKDGFETAISKNGAPITVNQCNIVSIARAAAGRPGLLLIDGVLDGLSDVDLEPVLEFLLAPERNWSVFIATGRESIAARCSRRIDLPSPTTLHLPQ